MSLSTYAEQVFRDAGIIDTPYSEEQIIDLDELDEELDEDE